jgi:hypothetical protein
MSSSSSASIQQPTATNENLAEMQQELDERTKTINKLANVIREVNEQLSDIQRANEESRVTIRSLIEQRTAHLAELATLRSQNIDLRQENHNLRAANANYQENAAEPNARIEFLERRINEINEQMAAREVSMNRAMEIANLKLRISECESGAKTNSHILGWSIGILTGLATLGAGLVIGGISLFVSREVAGWTPLQKSEYEFYRQIEEAKERIKQLEAIDDPA